MSSKSKKQGKEGEDIAADLLVSKGYEIIKRNYRYQKGEIDIIAKDPETGYLVFVEVKSKYNIEYGLPEYSMTKNKINQVKKVAELYLYENDIQQIDCRFDVVTVLFRYKLKPVINHYVNAFM